MAIDFGDTFNSSRYYTISGGASGLALPNADWCVGVWVRFPHGCNTAADFQYLLSGGTLGAANSFHLFFGDSTNAGKAVIRLRGAAGTEINSIIGELPNAPSYVDETDRLLIVQRRGANIEGFLVAKDGAVSGPSLTVSVGANTGISPASWDFGRQADGAAGRYFQNVASELFILTDDSLSPAQVQELATGKSVTCMSGCPELYLKFDELPAPTRLSLASDNFERADVSPVDGNWAAAGAFQALQIISGRLAGTNGSNRAAFNNSVTWRPRQWAKATIGTLGTGEGGPAVRIGTSSVNAYCVDAYNGTVRLSKHVADAWSSMGSWTKTTVVGDSLSIEADGTTIRAFHNDELVGSVTDTSLATGNAGAVILNQARLEDWEGGTLFDVFDRAKDHHADQIGSGFALATHPISGPQQYIVGFRSETNIEGSVYSGGSRCINYRPAGASPHTAIKPLPAGLRLKQIQMAVNLNSARDTTWPVAIYEITGAGTATRLWEGNFIISSGMSAGVQYLTLNLDVDASAWAGKRLGIGRGKPADNTEIDSIRYHSTRGHPSAIFISSPGALTETVSGWSTAWAESLWAVFLDASGGTTTEVTKLQDIDWGVRSLIDAANAVNWSLRESITNFDFLLWNNRSFTAKSQLMDWVLRNLALAEAQFDYNLRAFTNASAPLEWNLKQFLGATEDFNWGTREYVSAQNDILWNTRNTVTSESGLLWALRERLDKLEAVSWKLHNFAQAQSELEWKLHELALNTLETTWLLRSNITKENDFTWNIQSLLPVIGRLEVLLWKLQKFVQTESSVLWNSREYIQADSELLWQERQYIFSPEQFGWNTRNPVANSFELLYNVREQVHSELGTAWPLNQYVVGNLETGWIIQSLYSVVDLSSGVTLESASTGYTIQDVSVKFEIQ